MKLCTKCNRLLKNSDTFCPYCAQEAAGHPVSDTGGAVELPVTRAVPAQAQSVTMEIPLVSADAAPPAASTEKKAPVFTPAPPPAAVAVAERPLPPVPASGEAQAQPAAPTREEEAKASAQAQGITMEIAFEGLTLDDDTSPEEEREPGVIERELEELDSPGTRRRSPLGKLGVTLIALLVLAACFFGVRIIQQLRSPAKLPTDAAMQTLVTGLWLSDEFAYVDNETQNYVELLALREDGTFSIDILIPNRNDPDGYLDGSWKTAESYDGTYRINADTKQVVLSFAKDGGTVTTVYVLVEAGDGSITLRENYNAEKTDYYDIHYKRLG